MNILENAVELPDGSGCAVGSFPLPKDHWLTQDEKLFETKADDSVECRIKRALRQATHCDTIKDFDPDALLLNFKNGISFNLAKRRVEWGIRTYVVGEHDDEFFCTEKAAVARARDLNADRYSVCVLRDAATYASLKWDAVTVGQVLTAERQNVMENFTGTKVLAKHSEFLSKK